MRTLVRCGKLFDGHGDAWANASLDHEVDGVIPQEVEQKSREQRETVVRQSSHDEKDEQGTVRRNDRWSDEMARSNARKGRHRKANPHRNGDRCHIRNECIQVRGIDRGAG